MSIKDILTNQPPEVVVETLRKRITTAKIYLAFRILTTLTFAVYSGIQSIFFSSNDILFRIMMTIFCITFSLNVITCLAELNMIAKLGSSKDLLAKIVEYQNKQ